MTDAETLTDTPPASESVAAFAQWIETALQQGQEQGPFEANPVSDVQHVRDLSPWILGPYQVRHGHVELAGCTLEPRPFLRLTFPASQPDRLRHVWFGGDGQPIDGDLIRRLGLAQLQPCAARLRKGDAPRIDQWIQAALNGMPAAVRRTTDRPNGVDLRAATVAWCRWASGKVAFSFADGQHSEMPFEGWAADYRSGRLLPPTYHCPESGLASYQVCCLDDGTITVAEALARCEQSGAEVLAARLSECQVTGRRALRELMVRCEITGQHALAEAAGECQWCGRPVLPAELQAGRCGDCRHLQRIPGRDRLLQQVLQQHPELAAYRRWRGWQNQQLGVFVGGRLTGDVVLVCDAGTGQLRRRGRRGRLKRRWQMESPPGDRPAAEPGGAAPDAPDGPH